MSCQVDELTILGVFREEHGSVKSIDAAFAKVIDQSFDMRILCHQTLNSLCEFLAVIAVIAGY